MTFYRKLGSFTVTSGQALGTVAITDVGFEPKVIFFMTADNDRMAYGIAHGSSFDQWSISMYASDSGQVVKSHSTQGTFLAQVNTSGTGYEWEIAMDSLDSDGFTYDLTKSPSSNITIQFLALGGDDITDVASDNWLLDASTGVDTVTGVGFQPELVIVAGAAADNTLGTESEADIFFGAADFRTNQFCSCFKAIEGFPSSAFNRASDDSFYLRTTSGLGEQASRAKLVSMDDDGFTFNVTDAPPVQVNCLYLALRGDFNVHVQPDHYASTSSGDVSTTNMLFKPEVMLLPSSMRTETYDSSFHDDGCFLFGWGVHPDGSTAIEQVCCSFCWDDNSTGETEARTLEDQFIDITGFSIGVLYTEAAASLVSMDRRGWTMNWSNAASNAKTMPMICLAGGCPSPSLQYDYTWDEI